MNPCPPKNYYKSIEVLRSYSTSESVCPSKSSGSLAQPVVSDLFFNIAKYIFHFGLIIYYTTCCGRSIVKADSIKGGPTPEYARSRLAGFFYSHLLPSMVLI